ncbi:MAG: hypothetical protein ACLTW9_06500 [Enterocloster sp.]
MVLKLIDKVKFLLRILSCVTVCTLTIIIGIQVVNRYVFWNFIYMGGGAGRHGHGLHYIFRRSHGHHQ